MNKRSLKYHCPEHPDRPPFCAIGDYTPCRECYYKFRGIKIALIVLWFSCISWFSFAADPNQADFSLAIFTSHWLEPTTIRSKWRCEHITEYWYDFPFVENKQTRILITSDPDTEGLTDPNLIKMVTDRCKFKIIWQERERFNLKYWTKFAQNYRPLVIIEPNSPADPCEPNLPSEPNTPSDLNLEETVKLLMEQ